MTTIRAAVPGDHAAVAELARELGTDETFPAAERWERDLMAGTLVAERGGAVIAYINYYELAAAGYVRMLAVAPAARNAGIGRTLMEAVAARLRERGLVEWQLNVKADNAPAIHLYERLGLQPQHRTTVVRVPWERVGELARAGGVRAAAVEPEQDPAIEQRLGVLAGRLAEVRKRAGRVIVQLLDTRAAPVGIACLDPAIPGAYPFRVARPAFARTLLDALHPHVADDPPWIQLVVEDDDELATELIAIGSDVRMRLVRYRGVMT